MTAGPHRVRSIRPHNAAATGTSGAAIRYPMSVASPAGRSPLASLATMMPTSTSSKISRTPTAARRGTLIRRFRAVISSAYPASARPATMIVVGTAPFTHVMLLRFVVTGVDRAVKPPGPRLTLVDKPDYRLYACLMVIDKGDGGGTGASPASDGMYSDQHLRVSDAERKAASGQLAEHFAAGRLDQAEFDDRVGRAISAKTRGDLRGLFADLSETGAPTVPELPRGGGGSPGDGPRGPGSPIEFRLDAASGAIKPNTVLKAYKELETKGLTAGRPGQGTFIQATLGQVALPELAGLHKSLLGWLTTADEAGLDEDGIVALFASALRDFYKRRSGTGERRAARSGEAEGVA